jgi:hypothetical protein
MQNPDELQKRREKLKELFLENRRPQETIVRMILA